MPLVRNRTCVSLLLSMVFIVLFVVFHPQKESDEKRLTRIFYANKVNAPAKYDLVAIGDSRVGLDISAPTIEGILSDYDILMFDFNGGGLNSTIFEAAAEKLDPESSKKTIFMGISPRTFTLSSAENQHYQIYAGNSLSQILDRMLSKYFLRIDVPILANQLLQRNTSAMPNVSERFEQDGERSVIVTGPVDPNPTLQQYVDLFAEDSFTQELFNETIEQIAEWREEDICVYGTRLPISEELLDIENRLSGFDENYVRSALEQAGLTWIEIDMADYETYDGSHLDEENAQQLSRVIAVAIQNDACHKNQ